MRRAFMAVVIAGCLRVSAFAQADPVEPKNVRPEAAQTQQIQEQIISLYLADFKNEVGLTDEQFFNLNMPLRRIMRMRFQAPAQRQQLNQRLQELLSQSNPSEADVQKLTQDIGQHDRDVATLEAQFLKNFGSQLSPRQQLLFKQFNQKFLNERLPGLINQARERNAATLREQQLKQQRQQQRQKAGAAAKQNQTRPNAAPAPVRPGNALRGKPTPSR